MISVVIPTLNAEARLAATLNALVVPAIDGLVKEVIIADGGSRDDTAKIADLYGAHIITAAPGRGGQLAAGARAAKGEWLLFLHADTVLEDCWAHQASHFIADHADKAAVFTLRFDAAGLAPSLVAGGAMLRTRLLAAPYGDQGLLISRALYEAAGGYADLKLMEDVEFIRRLVRFNGRGALRVLSAKATTSAERYARDGYARRVLRNAIILTRYFMGASPDDLARDYR